MGSDPFIFVKDEYVRAQGHPNAQWVECEGLGMWFFSLGAICVSGYKSSFGGPVISGALSKESISELLKEWEALEESSGCKEGVIQLAPDCYYGAEIEVFEEVLLEYGWILAVEEVNQYLNVGGDFYAMVDAKKRRYLNRGTGLYSYEQIKPEDAEAWRFAYRVISEQREARGYEISQSEEEFMDMVKRYPQAYTLHRLVNNEGKVVAVAVTVHINAAILYLFHHAEVLDEIKNSPVVYLDAKIYEFAQMRGYKLFDLGTSSVNGEVNAGLFRYKAELGGQACAKRRYTKKLEIVG